MTDSTFNILNMGAGCDCDPDAKKAILDDLDGYVDCLNPDVKRFFMIDYLDCLKPDKTINVINFVDKLREYMEGAK